MTDRVKLVTGDRPEADSAASQRPREDNEGDRSSSVPAVPTTQSRAVRTKSAQQPVRVSADKVYELAPTRVEPPVVEDPLGECLAFLTKLYGRPYTPLQLQAGMALVQGRLTMDSLIKSAERIGMVAARDRCQLRAIPRLALPAIMVLRDDRACVLVQFKERDRVEVFEPRAGEGTRVIPLRELEALYTGAVIYVRPRFNFDERAHTLEIAEPKSWFWAGIRQNWWIYGYAVLATVVVNILALASPLFIMTVYDRVVPNAVMETLYVLALGVAMVAVFDFMFRTIRGYLIDVAGKRLDVRLGNRIFEHVLNLQMEVRPRSAGSLASTLREFDILREFMSSVTVTAFGDMPFIALFILVIYLIGGPVAYVPLVAVPIVILVGMLIQIPLYAVALQAMRESTQKNALLFEVLNGIETIKGIHAEGWARRHWEHFVALTAVSSMKMKMLTLAATHFTLTSTLLVIIGIVVVGVHEISAGNMTSGALVACVLLSSRVMAPLGQVAGLLVRYDQTKLAFEALHQLMKAPAERPPEVKLVHKPYLDGAIEFKGVSFTYPGADVPAVNDISFGIAGGEHVAVLGRIGSGKSTVLKLIQNLYRPSAGFVRIDDLDSRHIELSDLRRGIGYVPQDTVLFHGTIRENLTQGAPHATDEQVMQAAQLSGLAELIRVSPKGLDHEVEERGAALSGGQRQMISVARALVLGPPILLMDEPTSNMDNVAERQFIEHMLHWLKGRTLVVVTHRASMLRLVDRIILLDKGKIVADAPKDEVMALLAAGKIQGA
ncbi:MAG: type I secretion system permease/ATPase [Kiloniellales bacterium]